MGLDGKVTAPDGSPITSACGNDAMPQIDCDPAKNGADCPSELTNPMCVTIEIIGLTQLYNCAQLCRL